MSVLGLIPARGGSKGIPRKNILDFNGRPLIVCTIEAAKDAECISRVVVSTEDEEVANISRAWGADVPFMRPVGLASDDTAGIEPVLHALSILPKFDWILVLQPTSPLRTAQDIEAVMNLAETKNASSVVSVCEASTHPYWTYQRDTEEHLSPLVSSPSIYRRQDLPPAYALNGALYLARCDWLLQSRTFMSPETLGYVMPIERSVDIDSPLDWKWAEFLMKEQDHG